MKTNARIGILSICLSISACSSPSLDLAYTDRRPDLTDRAVIATGEVVQLATPFVESQSIAGNRYLARVALDRPAQIGEWRGSSIKLRYDKYGLWFAAPKLGDRLTFVFTPTGDFIDVMPRQLHAAGVRAIQLLPGPLDFPGTEIMVPHE